jgi:hypothetical protein
MATPPGRPDEVGRPVGRGSGDHPANAGHRPAHTDDNPGCAATVPNATSLGIETATGDGRPGLRAAAAVGPFFAIDRLDDDPSWRPLSEFADHPDGLTARVTATVTSSLLQALRPPTPSAERVRIAASVAFLGLAARLVSPALGSVLSTGIVPKLSPERLYWRPAPTGVLPLACGAVDGWASDQRSGTDPESVALLGETAIIPVLALGATVAARFGLSEQVVKGNVASAITGATAAVVRSGRCTERAAVDLATALLRGSGLTGSGSFVSADRTSPEPQNGARFRRNSCCLLYRAGGGFCGDCVLASDGVTLR